MRRTLLILGLFLMLGSPLVLRAPGVPDGQDAAAIAARPLDVAPGVSEAAAMGRLRYLAGWELVSRDPDFGGLSAMAVEGRGFVAIGDAGGVFVFTLDRDGRIAEARISKLPAGPTRADGGAPRKFERDAEALAFDRDTGRYWAGFEGYNAIWRYAAEFSAAEANAAPDAMAGWPDNGGVEAMVRMEDGRFFVFSEHGDGPDGSREALLFAGDPSEPGPAPVRFGYRPLPGYDVTDAALLPGGQKLLLLNRRFSFMEGVSVALTEITIAAIAEGAVVTGRLVGRVPDSLLPDNMEALAVTRENGRTIVWMASDDNFNPLQRTQLFRFSLGEG